MIAAAPGQVWPPAVQAAIRSGMHHCRLAPSISIAVCHRASKLLQQAR